MTNNKNSTIELECPDCQTKVPYNPDDPIHVTHGAMLVKADQSGPDVVYLRCPTCDELKRFELSQ